MANLAAQQIGITGLNPAFVAASAGGDSTSPDDRVCLRVKNGSGASVNVTLLVPGTTYGQANPDPVIAVPAGGDVAIALPAAISDPATGLVGWSYSAVASVTVSVVRI